jgi:hypothetical protein
MSIFSQLRRWISGDAGDYRDEPATLLRTAFAILATEEGAQAALRILEPK